MEKQELSNLGLVPNPNKSVLNSDHQSRERASFRFQEIQVKELDKVTEKQAVRDESNLLMILREQKKEMEALTKATNSESHLTCGADKTKCFYTETDNLKDIHSMEEASSIPNSYDEQNKILTTSLQVNPRIGDGDQNGDKTEMSKKGVELVKLLNTSPVNQCVVSGVVSEDQPQISANQIYSNIKSIHKNSDVQVEVTISDTEDYCDVSKNEKFQHNLMSSPVMKPDLLVDKQISETMENSGSDVKVTECEDHHGKAQLSKEESQEVQAVDFKEDNVAVMQNTTAYRDVKTEDWSSDSESDSQSPSVISTSSPSSSSEDSSDDESSSSSSSPESISENKTTEQVTRCSQSKIKVNGELDLSDLPLVEDLHISVPEEEMQHIGEISGIVDQLVVVQSLQSMPALDLDSVLFLAGGKPLGEIFDVFGPVLQPSYAVRFNNHGEIVEKEISIGLPVYYAPTHEDITSYVFVEQLRKLKGSDASWKDNAELPCALQEFSDDDEEKKFKQKLVAKNRNHEKTNEEEPKGKQLKKKEFKHKFDDKNSGRSHLQGSSVGRNPFLRPRLEFPCPVPRHSSIRGPLQPPPSSYQFQAPRPEFGCAPQFPSFPGQPLLRPCPDGPRPLLQLASNTFNEYPIPPPPRGSYQHLPPESWNRQFDYPQGISSLAPYWKGTNFAFSAQNESLPRHPPPWHPFSESNFHLSPPQPPLSLSLYCNNQSPRLSLPCLNNNAQQQPDINFNNKHLQ